jgi:hypothetical protein
MNERAYGENVRVVCKPTSNAHCDLCVQTRTSKTAQWVTRHTYNDETHPEAVELADSKAEELRLGYEAAAIGKLPDRADWPFMCGV